MGTEPGRTTGSPVDREALDWVLRVGDPAFEDWDAYTEWLEADPRHPGRYDEAALALAAAEAHVARVPVRRGAGRPRFASGAREWARASGAPRAIPAMAAALAALVGVGVWRSGADGQLLIETGPGQSRVVALADGGRVVLGGGSRLRLGRAGTRTASLEGGEAIFQIRHDPASPFTVRAGDLTAVDAGTVFDVKRAGAVTRVAVAEGAVLIDPGGAGLPLGPGQAVVSRGGVLERRAAGDVGGWRSGRLTFEDATLEEIAADLSRETGRSVTVGPALAASRRTAALRLADMRDDPVLLARLLDVRVDVQQGRWRFEGPR